MYNCKLLCFYFATLCNWTKPEKTGRKYTTNANNTLQKPIKTSLFSHKYMTMVRVYRTLQHALHHLRFLTRHLMMAPDESAPVKRSATLG